MWDRAIHSALLSILDNCNGGERCSVYHKTYSKLMFPAWCSLKDNTCPNSCRGSEYNTAKIMFIYRLQKSKNIFLEMVQWLLCLQQEVSGHLA